MRYNILKIQVLFKILLSLLLLTGTYSCKKLKKLTRFNINYSMNATIPASSGINLPFNILTPDVETNSESTFAVNDTRKDLINYISLNKLNVVLESPDNSDLSFVKSAKVYISAEGLDELELANIDNVGDNIGKTIQFEVSKKDFKEYIKKDEFNLRLQVVTDKMVGSDHDVKINTTFEVEAKLIGN